MKMKSQNNLKGNIKWIITSALFVLIANLFTALGEESKFSYPERHRFESLLAGGRALAFPFSTGFLLTLVSSDKINWNVSQSGLENVLTLPSDQLLPTYAAVIQDLQKDENTTWSSVVYAFHEGFNNSTSLEYLDKLGSALETVVWNTDNANDTWELMNSQLTENTNGLLDDKLIPKNSALGNPFPFSTESTILSTFHYRNFWRNSWSDAGLMSFPFYSRDVRVPFIKTQGEFLFSEQEDFTAVKIPLEGDEKSVVFVLPKINITKYFKTVVARSGEKFGINGDTDEDIVPFPKTFEKRSLSVLIPSFNLTASDQYGKELVELGMNETFCTTLFDLSGKIPYYLRPIVQVNRVELTQDSLEIASATGSAVQKFFIGLDIHGNGYPRSQYKSPSEQEHTTTDATPGIISGSPLPVDPVKNYTNSDNLIFDKPFLWYLEDRKLGPLFYGIVQNLESENEEEINPEKASAREEAEKFILWSCKTFKQSADIGKNDENEVIKKSDL